MHQQMRPDHHDRPRQQPSWWRAPGVRAVMLAVLDDEPSDAAVAAAVLEPLVLEGVLS